MEKSYLTDRLQLSLLETSHTDFIYQLTNTAAWVKNIGNRNITDRAAALSYIEAVDQNPFALYWVAERLADQRPLGIVTYLKRPTLPYWDIGFAFLPDFHGMGYAYEAAQTILEKIMEDPSQCPVLATTLAHNQDSIKLLNRLGMSMEKKLDGDLLLFSTNKCH